MATVTPTGSSYTPSHNSTEKGEAKRPVILQRDTLSSAEEEDSSKMLFEGTLPSKGDEPVFEKVDVALFDLDEMGRASGQARKKLIQKFGDELRDVGFLAVKAKRLVLLIHKMFAEMEAYFDQLPEDKFKDWRGNNGSGYSEKGRETAAGATHPDLKEFYHIPPNYKEWPKNRPAFAAVMQDYHAELSEYIARSLVFLAEYLDEPAEDIETSMQSAGNLLRLICYPPLKETDPAEAMRAAPHEDLNALTALPPATAPGLQLRNKRREWVDVVAPEGYLIINTGKEVEKKTAGYIKAIRHRVLNPGGEWARKKRLAAVYFGSWSKQYSLKPFESCITKVCAGMNSNERETYLKQYPDVSVEENLNARLIEMGTIKTPERELVASLREKGLLRLPTAWVKSTYPDLFGDG